VIAPALHDRASYDQMAGYLAATGQCPRQLTRHQPAKAPVVPASLTQLHALALSGDTRARPRFRRGFDPRRHGLR